MVCLQGENTQGETVASYIKHFLDETESNIRLKFPGQVMLGEAKLKPVSADVAKLI